MTKRSAETVADHESVPAGALPFFAPFAKRSRSRGGCDAPSSPSDPLALRSHAFSSSSDEMSDVSDAGAADQADAVSAHHLSTAPGCWATLCAAQSQQHQLSALGLFSAPACPDARAFLEQLTGCVCQAQHLGSSNPATSLSMAASVGTAMWHAFAELNVVMARHFPQLPTGMLRGYHSFTRAQRAQLWDRLAASQGAQAEDPGYGQSGWPPHLLLTRFLLEHVLAAYPTASCVVYTVELPPWLRSWCARWGHPHSHHHGHHGHGHALPPGSIRVMALFAYASPLGGGGAGGSSSSGGGGGMGPGAVTQPPRVIYVPCP